MLQTDLLTKIFYVQATLEHLAQLDAISAVDRCYLKRCVALQGEIARTLATAHITLPVADRSVL